MLCCLLKPSPCTTGPLKEDEDLCLLLLRVCLCRVLQADDDVANCVQCHPHLPVLATSGIDHAIKVREVWG